MITIIYKSSTKIEVLFMKQASITLRTDIEFKNQCDTLFKKLGLTTVAAINSFLHQAVMEQAMPFKPSVIKDRVDDYLEKIPEAGHINSKGNYVLPKEWNNEEDDIYDSLVK